MPRLRRSDCSEPGIRRRGRGRGFEYVEEDGSRVTDAEVLERISELSIPPAWKDVWICLDPLGHLQATGVDAAGRKQYLYHQKWRQRRDAKKFDEMIDFARDLPRLRRRVASDLRGEGMGRERALACAVRLLDRGLFRIGGEDYAEENETYGVATMLKQHVALHGGTEMRFDYEAKGGQRRVQRLVDEQVYPVVAALKRRRGGSEELLAYKEGGRWVDVRSEDVNEYIKEAAGGDFSAKDFRTWSATVLAAVTLAAIGEVAESKTGRKRAINQAVKEVAGYLGNTPAICRASYIDPRVFDRYREGITIGGVVGEAADSGIALRPRLRRRIEKAVIDLIAEEDSPALAKAA